MQLLSYVGVILVEYGNDIHRIHLLAHSQGMRLLGSICISGRARGYDVTRALIQKC